MAHVDWLIKRVMELAIEPIRNPVTGRRTARRSGCPRASSSARRRSRAAAFTGAGDELGFDNRDCYACLTHVAYGPYGIVEG